MDKLKKCTYFSLAYMQIYAIAESNVDTNKNVINTTV